MNIAYLFSGHARTWELCYTNFFTNIYNYYPGDIFIHTWDRINAANGAHWNTWSSDLESASAKKIDNEKIIQIYNPIKCVIESDPGLDALVTKYPDINPINCLGAKNLLYSQKTVFDISKNYKKYDKYFCTRLDINYISIEENNLKEFYKTEYVASNSLQHPEDMVFDFWSICSFDQMMIKSNYINEIDNYWFTKNIADIPYERALYNYLKDKDIEIYRSKIAYNIPRINDSITSYI